MGSIASKQKLSKEDLEFLRENTSYNKSTIKEWFKCFRQNCPNGKMTPSKFVNLYKQSCPSGNADEYCRQAFRTFDTDNNGYIDFKEFLLAMDVTAAGTPEQKLKWAFKMYDVDGNGLIDLEEMKEIMQAIYNMVGISSTRSNESQDSVEARAMAIFKKMDANNDGNLTEEEFINGCLQDEEVYKVLTVGLD